MNGDSAFDRLDALHDQAHHVHAAECCWPPPGVTAELAAMLEAARASERAKFAWWLRAGANGPARVNLTAEVRANILEMADVIEQHPERWTEAPDTAAQPRCTLPAGHCDDPDQTDPDRHCCGSTS